ncbi:MAG TPA: pitrilysin family protein [Symbiobacteriaceae bacterium]|nr:pitrilysin family protein [Symbiobacteriaceae bacterium]
MKEQTNSTLTERTDPLLQERLYTTKLACGLTVAIIVKPGFHEKTARIATHYGSIDSRFIHPETGEEIQVPDGIAHFLEHKLFEKEWGNVSDKFSELGAEANAYTTYTHTVYYFNTTDRWEESLDLLLDYVQTPWFTDESVEKEQGIIEQEIRMYLDDPGWRSNANLLEALYQEHPLRIDIAGTVESIHQIDKETLTLCHKTFYHPSNMVLFVAGDVDPEATLARVKAAFDTKGYKPQAEIKRLMPKEPTAPAEKRREQALVVNQPIFRLGFKDPTPTKTGRELLAHDLLTAMAVDVVAGRSSPLYTELYEAGLIDQRFGFEYSCDETWAYSYFAGMTRDPEALHERLSAGIQQAVDQGLSPEAFERIKRKTIGRMVGMMNDLDSIAWLFIDSYFKEMDVFDLIPVASELTVEQANQRLREHFRPEQAAVSLIKPK